MLRTGLVSVTFRQLTPAEIIPLVAQAQLAGIEWGGDVHVPPGNSVLAQQVQAMTADAGLETASYGSYFRASEDDPALIPAVVATAKTLQAPTIRIWAGRRGSAKADPEYRRQVAAGARAMAVAAAAEGIKVAFEYHQDTVADNYNDALALLADIDHPNINMYWQPQKGETLAEGMAGLQRFMPRLCNIHVFNSLANRAPLADDLDSWLQYLALPAASERTHWAMVEFVKENQPAAFLADAQALRLLVEKL